MDVLKGVFTARYNKKRNCYYVFWYNKILFWKVPFCRINYDGELIVFSQGTMSQIMDSDNLCLDFSILQNAIKFAFEAVNKEKTNKL